MISAQYDDGDRLYIKKLEAEVERYAKQVAQLDALRHEAEQDAMRYRWLRKDDSCLDDMRLPTGTDLDAAIDAAMGEKP